MAHAISPELVLVDPELARAERARLVEAARLAGISWNIEPSSARRPAELRTGSSGSRLPRSQWRDVAVVAVIGLSLATNGALAAVLLARNGGVAVPATQRPAPTAAEPAPVDTQGRLYVATEMGVQVCDQAGRVQGIILKPQDKWLSNVAFGGPEFDTLYATCEDKVFKRKTKAKGVLSFEPAIKPTAPRL